MKICSYSLATLFCLFSPTLSFANDNPPGARELSPRISYATNYSTPKHSISKPSIRVQLRGIVNETSYCDSCPDRGCGCGPAYPDFYCCESCYIPPGNTNGECE